MANIEKGYYPLPQANTESIHFNLNLPSFLDLEKIGVNLREITRICKLSGIKDLRVVSYEGDLSRGQPTIVGFNRKGEAYAGKMIVTHAEESQSSSRRLWSTRINATTTVNVEIGVNLREISDKILRERKTEEGVRTIQAWAVNIDKAVKKGLEKEGTKNLIKKENRLSLGLGYVQDGMLLTCAGFLPIVHRPQDFAITVGVPTFLKLFHKIIATREEVDYRVSLFFGSEFDRAVLLKFATKMRHLVKEVKEK